MLSWFLRNVNNAGIRYTKGVMSDDNVLLAPEKEFQKQYRLSKWWVEHRDGLRRLGIISFACVDAVFVIIAGWAFVDAYLVSYADERRAVLELAAYGQADLHAYTVANVARDLEVAGATAVSSTVGNFDLYATVTNPNDSWWAEFTYVFSSSAGETEPASGFVLPNSEKPIVAYAIPSSATPRSVALVVSDITWHHVDHHLTGDYATWIADRLNFVVEDAAFETVDVDEESLSRAVFTVKNESAYSYYEPKFVVRLLRGSTLVGVTGTTLGSIDAGATENVIVNWFGPKPAVNNVEVVAEVNPFDIGTYKPLEGETTEDTRTRVFPRGR